jgi:hypothetical protein
MSQITARSDTIVGSYLASKLENELPFICREARFFFQRVDIGDRAIFAEDEDSDQEVKQLLRVRSPPPQGDSCPRPGSLA